MYADIHVPLNGKEENLDSENSEDEPTSNYFAKV